MNFYNRKPKMGEEYFEAEDIQKIECPALSPNLNSMAGFFLAEQLQLSNSLAETSRW